MIMLQKGTQPAGNGTGSLLLFDQAGDRSIIIRTGKREFVGDLFCDLPAHEGFYILMRFKIRSTP